MYKEHQNDHRRMHNNYRDSKEPEHVHKTISKGVKMSTKGCKKWLQTYSKPPQILNVTTKSCKRAALPRQKLSVSSSAGPRCGVQDIGVSPFAWLSFLLLTWFGRSGAEAFFCEVRARKMWRQSDTLVKAAQLGEIRRFLFSTNNSCRRSWTWLIGADILQDR